ncbi:MAG TPA: 3'(2'),5'-bisphosphate nucleotidase CysQ [Xanthobacteraceae bacterium]|nr:3'(2'),5'-bisphosphate nucleotidase CysQ [Xanthobacteraceae bacterium]
MSAGDKLPLAKNRSDEITAEDAVRVLGDAAVAAGRLARGMRAKGLKTWIKGKESPVSDADIAADALLRERLTAAAPHYEWLSEESAEIEGKPSHRRRWVVDPIDGTRAFIKGQSDWSVSVALIEDGRPIAAALFVPETEELFTAVAGKGAAKNDTKIHVSHRSALAGARIAGPVFLLQKLEETSLRFESVPRIHSLALRFVRAATGEIDLAISSRNSRDWDLAAADLILHQAGGTLTDADGVNIVYGHPGAQHPPLLACGLGLHPAALAVAGKIFADTAA